MSWTFQEWYCEWTLWAFGWTTEKHGGWHLDELTLAFGPVRWVFVSDKAMNE